TSIIISVTMTSNQVTEDDLLVQSQGFRTSSDIDSDLSDEGEFSPEPEELIQGSSDGLAEAEADSAGAPKTRKKKQSVPLPQPRKTDKPPPQNKPKQ
ncbi:hypothetical protein BDR07DRAFT_1410502, partial [Suillus spraguei]